MTANEIIVDRFDGQITPKDNTVKINVQARTADNAAEIDVVNKLQTAFKVTQGKTDVLDETDYTSSTVFEVLRAVDRKTETQKIDKRALAHLAKLRKRLQAKAAGAE
jgi:hypothetical protein